MSKAKFEVYGSLKGEMNGTEAFLLSNKTVVLNYPQLVEAICLHQHKRGLKEEKCIGYKITDQELILLFER